MTEAGIDWRRPGSSAVVAEFLAELAEPRRIRNALAHGITSARADPWSPDDPVVVCKLDDGSLRKITLSELKATQVRIERLRLQLRRIDTAA